MKYLTIYLKDIEEKENIGREINSKYNIYIFVLISCELENITETFKGFFMPFRS